MIGTKAKEEKAGRVGVLCLLLNLCRNACVHTHWMCTPLCNVVYMPVLRGFTCRQQAKKILGVGPNISMHGVSEPLRYLACGILRDTFPSASLTYPRFLSLVTSVTTATALWRDAPKPPMSNWGVYFVIFDFALFQPRNINGNGDGVLILAWR